MQKIIVILLSLLAGLNIGFGQQQPPATDTTVGGLPRLEIPEITIVGKKAITLPFARKGEIYDVTIYEAPPPDTSLIEQRPAISLPIGSLPRYDEPLVPWHLSAEGSLGSFTTVNGRAFVDYKGPTWGFYGNGGFSTTQGHVEHASGNALDADVTAHSLVSTDNEILKAFRFSAGTRLLKDSYGMFGRVHGDTTVDRSRSNVVLDAQLNSIEHTTNDVSLNLSANIWSVTDKQSFVGDSGVSVVSPKLGASYATDLGKIRLMTGVSFTSSSLNYDRDVQSPSVSDVFGGVQWQLSNQWFLSLGGRMDNGSGSDGENRSLVAPFASVRWQLDADRRVSFWFDPAMRLTAYDDFLCHNPYIVRDIDVRPERTPVNLGSSFWFNSGAQSAMFSIELSGSFAKSSNRAIMLADSAGRIRLGYVDASVFTLQAQGLVSPTKRTRVKFTGTIQPAMEDGSSTQLPMTPIVRVGGRGEMDLNVPLTLWTSLEYTSKQNVDRAGSTTLGDRVLMDVGASSSIIPKMVLSLAISNLLGTEYDWWWKYVAPGRAVMLSAKFNVQ